MRIECAWCKTLISEGDLPVSHGICDSCFVDQLEHRALSAEEHAWCGVQPHHGSAQVDNCVVEVWYTDSRTLIHCAPYWWAYDCRLSVEMVLATWRKLCPQD